MEGKKIIAVFGSINADLTTSVDRHAKPGETVAGSDYSLLPGGKGANQALAAKRAGASVAMIGSIGTDGFADNATVNLRRDDVDIKGVSRRNGSTGVAFIAVDGQGENSIVVTPGANARVEASQIAGCDCSILITQQELGLEQVWEAHRLAKSAGATIIHNAAPAAAIPLAMLRTIDYLVVNGQEALTVARSIAFNGDDPVKAGCWLQHKSGNSVVATLGAAGAFAVGDDLDFRVAAPKTDVRDTTGAGDTFVGAFAAALDQNASFRDAVENGVFAGSLACRELGAQTSIPTAVEIENLKYQTRSTSV